MKLRIVAFLAVLVFLAASMVGLALSAESPAAVKASATGEVHLIAAVSDVKPLIDGLLCRPPSDVRTRRLMQSCYDSVRRWDDILLQHIQPVPGKLNCAYYGDGGNEENEVRPIAYAAMVNAFLAEVQPPSSGVTSQRRARMRTDAIAALSYLTQGHVTGNGTCLNGKRWGNQWQSAMWTRAAGIAGWFLWSDLPDQLKQGVARLVEFEANRFLEIKPKSREFLDTGAEENAWNAQILSLACNMMPKHPRATAWAQAAKLWMYNSLSVAADTTDVRLGDDGRQINQWGCTTNAHPDFTVENHGIVHVGYLKTTISMLLEGALPYLLTGTTVPQACQHHAAEGFEIVLRCMGWDAAPIYFSGNDWKLVQTQSEDLMSYALMSLLAGDRNAAYLEGVAMDCIAREQRAEGGYYNVRRDIEYGGLCATRLIAAYLAHAVLGAGAKPASTAEFQRHVSGVTLLDYGKVLLHRTPTKFASFSWGPKRMALALPENGTWVVWPHFASYIGHLNGVDASPANATLRAIHPEVQADGFTVSGLLERFKGKVQQSFSFTSLAGDATVYMERLKCNKDFIPRSRETGIVGLEYDLGRNQRRLYGQHGTFKTLGVGGDQARIVQLETDWLNIDDRVGHIVCRLPRVKNVMRFHDEVAGSGRVPKLQEWLSLIGEADPAVVAGDTDWVCLVTFLNQKHRETAKWASRVRFTAQGERAACQVGTEKVEVDFGSLGIR